MKDLIKEAFADMKKGFVTSLLLVLLGFMLGKVYTYDTIATDCNVLGMFRIHKTAFGCRAGGV